MDIETDVCADCNASSPQWASLNRGVVLCDECSSIHRQFGRHVSQIKHLKKSNWRKSQLEMVQYLVAAGANRYWEHILYEPMLSGRRSAQSTTASKHGQITAKKPKPNDPLHPNKAEFIREKYLFLGFFKKPQNLNQDDLNHQLHASVRTGVLETSLYLLALGANPNFVHPSKGTAPLHVACQYNQVGQVEVLLVYGADVCIRDSRGQTPIDIALDRSLANCENGLLDSLDRNKKLCAAWSPLVDTLVSAYYEVTDSLAYFLCRSVPDHKLAVLGRSNEGSSSITAGPERGSEHHTQNGQTSVVNGHFLVSTTLMQNGHRKTTSQLAKDDWMDKARYRLQQLPNLAFEDLCIDVYDEADRRLTNSFLEKLEPSMANDKQHPDQFLTLYFLPPNTAYSSVRNQARQKLGRLSTVEFHTLVMDILTEVSVRLLPLFPPCSPIHFLDAPLMSSSDQMENIPSAITTRSIPLPSVPMFEMIDGMVDPQSEPNSPTTNISSNESACDPESPPQTVSVKVVDDKNSNREVKTRRSDDPVYDQVAAESDITTLSTNGASSVPCSPIDVADMNPDFSSTETEIADKDSHISSLSDHTSAKLHTQVETANTTSSNTNSLVTSSSGSFPGSTRLHLSRTGRLHPNRASVPGAKAPSKFVAGIALSPVLEAANLAMDPISVSTHSRTPVHESSCCVASKNEMDRLRKENSVLKSELEHLQTTNKELESRLKQLEEKMMLINSHVASPESTQPLITNTPEVCAHNSGQPNQDKPTASEEKPVPEINIGQTKRSDSGNYSVGSQFMDSGVLFRQGIVLRANRMGSPVSSGSHSNSSSPSRANSSPLSVSRPEEHAASTWISKPVTSYVNNPPRLLPKPVILKTSVTRTMTTLPWSVNSPGSHFVTAKVSHAGDYVAPNSTGSPSPAPLRTSPDPISPRFEFKQPVLDRSQFPTKSMGCSSSAQQQQALQKQHEQILASIATLPDYDTPFSDSGDAPSSRLTYTPATTGSELSSGAKRNPGPTSDQIVRCVEAIIIRIRNLIQLANGDRSGDFVSCSDSIESSVQDIVRLFPSSVYCPPAVSGALQELASASRGLQPHCEQIASRMAHTGSCAPVSGPDVNAVIRHAHRIAKAAKDLLSVFQKPID